MPKSNTAETRRMRADAPLDPGGRREGNGSALRSPGTRPYLLRSFMARAISRSTSRFAMSARLS